jgi:mannose-6-phosphate isomerase-like protein (cupin superfamily)
MRIDNIENYTKGWFIGNFMPSLDSTENFEIALKRYSAGDKEPAHFHKIATEYTVITSGTVRMNDTVLNENQIAIVYPGEIIEFESLTDSCTVVIKTPSVKNDKYI